MPRLKSPFPPKTDFFSKYGAGLLADHINACWKGRGVKAERHLLWGTTWGVRSNLVNGLPPVRKSRTAAIVETMKLASGGRHKGGGVNAVVGEKSSDQIEGAGKTLIARRREFLHGA